MKAPFLRSRQLLILPLALGTAYAPGQVLEEVIVSATLRQESIMEVPLAISAIAGDTIRSANLRNIKDLIAYSPGVTGNSSDSFFFNVVVRGIGTQAYGIGGEPSIGLFKNGFYQGRDGAAISSLYDTERAEVLRGPQAFQFGRSVIAGAMNVITMKPNPDGVSGYAELQAGSRDLLVAEGAVNLPLGENTALRLAGLHSEEDGYITNRYEPLAGDKYGDNESSALRLSALHQREKLRVEFSLEYEDRQQSGYVYVPTGEGEGYDYLGAIFGDLGYPRRDNDITADMSLGSRDNAKMASAGLVIHYDLGVARLTSMTGYQDHEFDYAEDFDGLPIALSTYDQEQSGDYFEQDLRLVSPPGQALSWQAGFYYYREDIEATYGEMMAEDVWCSLNIFEEEDTCENIFSQVAGFAEQAPNNPLVREFFDFFGTFEWQGSPDGNVKEINRNQGDYEGYSLYGELDYAFSDRWRASAGLRYHYDEKSFSINALPNTSPLIPNDLALFFETPAGPVRNSDSWDSLTPRVIVEFQSSDNSLWFASYARGYKPGGYNSFSIAPASADYVIALPGDYRPAAFDEESSDAFELGYKGTHFSGKTQLAANAFFYRYEDFQLSYSQGPLDLVGNVGQADGWGIELELNQALGAWFTFNAAVAWFDGEGKDLQQVCDSPDPNACEGTGFPGVPEWSGHAIISGDYPLASGELYGMLGYHFQSSQQATIEPDSITIDGYGELNLSLGYRNGNYYISAFVDNATDEFYYDGGNNGDAEYPHVQYGPSRPRTTGIKLGLTY